jgi:hypothetical protein
MGLSPLVWSFGRWLFTLTGKSGKRRKINTGKTLMFKALNGHNHRFSREFLNGPDRFRRGARL